MNAHRVRGTISGIVFGLGLVILLQQFGVVPLTTLVLILVPIGCGLVGLAIGWPRRAGTLASTAPPGAAPGR